MLNAIYNLQRANLLTLGLEDDASLDLAS